MVSKMLSVSCVCNVLALPFAKRDLLSDSAMIKVENYCPLNLIDLITTDNNFLRYLRNYFMEI